MSCVAKDRGLFARPGARISVHDADGEWLPPEGRVADAGWRIGDSALTWTEAVATWPVASRQRIVAS